MNETERVVRVFHQSWVLMDPDRAASVNAADCQGMWTAIRLPE